MNDTLRVFSEIAGIGGLGMGLFLLVVKEVLKKVRPPGPDPDKGFQLLNRIIVFAFILALVGLAIYAATVIGK